MILKVLVWLLVVVAAILLYAAARPDEFRIERSVVVNAPPDKVFSLINDLRKWTQWNREQQSPDMTEGFDGPPSGVGAAAQWKGSSSAGQGRMVITESVPLTKVSVQVDWEKPFKVRNTNEFTLIPEGNATRVTWAMHGPNLFVMKVMSVFTNMDRVMGKHFESGLAHLKTAAER